MGVLNSCVMLLMKSFFISVNFFCRKSLTIVKIKVISNTRVKVNEGMLNRTDEKI